mgnify:FL=1|jgi:hypothetical protein|tara:strand:- start:831 stop:1088 length:258 start_codon:yes stop_codon:yes gene_type:complete
MQISSITIKQLAELAFSTESVDPIDWGELSIQEEQAYIIMASHLMEQFGNVKDDEITEKYLTLMATCVKLTVENFVLNLKLEGKQ